MGICTLFRQIGGVAFYGLVEYNQLALIQADNHYENTT